MRQKHKTQIFNVIRLHWNWIRYYTRFFIL